MRLIGICDKLDLCATFILVFGGDNKVVALWCVGYVLADIGKDLSRVSMHTSISFGLCSSILVLGLGLLV